jgi:protoporphyrinogen oxidase
MLEWMADEKGRLGVARRGLAELPAAASEKLEVSLRSAVDSLESASGDGYKVSCRGGATLEADAVVLATSGREAGRIARGQLVPAEQDFFASLRTVPENVLVAALARPATGVPQYVRVPAVENEVVEALLVEPGVADGRAPLGSGLVTAVANQRFCEANTGASDEVVQKELVASIERAFPSIVGTVRSTHLFREGREVPRFEVGAYRALARFRNVQSDRRKLGRRLYFAGDYLSGLAADQTVGSGRRAARDLIDDLRI